MGKVKSRCGRQEFGGESEERKRRGSFCCRTLPLLLILSCGVGAICGLCGVETRRTGWTAFAAGVVMVAVLRRWSWRELWRVEEKAMLLHAEVREETKAEFQSFLHPDFDKDFLQLLGTLDESSLWRSLEARTGWKTGDYDYATKLESVAAEARAVAARLNAAASQAHAFAEKLSLPGLGQGEDELSLRTVATGVSALGTDGMSTRSNVLFEDSECKSEDELSLDTGLTTETFLPKPEDCLLSISCRVGGVAPARPYEANYSPQTSFVAIDQLSHGETSTVAVREDFVYQRSDLMSVPENTLRSKDDLVPSNQYASNMQPVVQRQLDFTDVGDVIGLAEPEEEAVEDLADGADSCHEAEDICPENGDEWHGGTVVTPDLFEDVASEEATLNSRITDSEIQGSVSGEGCPIESAASKQGPASHFDATALGLHGVAGTGTTASYRTTWTEASFDQSEDELSSHASPDERFPSRTLSFREAGTGHRRLTTESVTSRHRVSKSDGEFVFQDSLDGSASERENISSVTSSPLGHGSSLKPMGSVSASPADASPIHVARKISKPQGIASRLRGVLKSNRFTSSKVVPRRDETASQGTRSKKEDASKANVAPKREDVLKGNRIPSGEAASKVGTGAKALRNATPFSARRRLMS